jgi:subtilisin family serine protease
MRRSKMCVMAFLAAAGFAAAPTSADVGRFNEPVWGPDVFGGYATDHVIVQVVPGFQVVQAAAGIGFGVPEIDALLAQWGVLSVGTAFEIPFGNPELAADIGLDRYYRINTPEGTDTPALVEALARFNAVFGVAEVAGIGGTAHLPPGSDEGGVALIPNDTSFNNLWGMHNTGQNITSCGVGTVDADIDAVEAWDLHTGTSSIVLAVIDSGVDNHVDLAGKVLTGWNTVLNNTNVSDTCIHGTHVAGTAGANGNNALGVVGVSWGVQILPIKVLTGCSGTTTDCAEGVTWGADNGAHVETMSLQYYTFSQLFQDSVAYAHGLGVLVIAATGNSQAPGTIAWPAKFPFCMGIGATTNKDAKASFSNSGNEIDVSAPGQCVYSSIQTANYAFYDGTSMATPHVSGLACLMWSFNPALSNDEIEQILKDTVDDKGAAGWDSSFGWGRINARAAMEAAMGSGGGPVDAPLSAFSVVTGTLSSGNLASLQNSDDSRLHVLGGAQGNRFVTNVQVDAISPVAIVSQLDVAIESSLASGTATIAARIFNHDTNSWNILPGSGVVTTTDSLLRFLSIANPNAYVRDSDGLVRIQAVTRTNAGAAQQTHRIDEVAVTVVAPESVGGCLADCDGDGSVNVMDYLCFQGWVTTGDARADCNFDNQVNVLDFLCFAAAVADGCH